ncbi:MAG: hypothetical protein F6K31_12930 [Symploca sp. SIO2G7]|nr:hypothetical protein [Symploca sp. SIO2G7]
MLHLFQVSRQRSHYLWLEGIAGKQFFEDTESAIAYQFLLFFQFLTKR